MQSCGLRTASRSCTYGLPRQGNRRSSPYTHLIEQGFLAFVEASAPSPLFYDPKQHGKCSLSSLAETQNQKIGKGMGEAANLNSAAHPITVAAYMENASFGDRDRGTS